jgi:dTDP-glucose 4,6-dehydratase
VKLLITGGAGFIGGNFVHHIARTHPEYKIVCFDKLTYAGNLETLTPVMQNKNFSFIRGTLLTGNMFIKSFAMRNLIFL